MILEWDELLTGEERIVNKTKKKLFSTEMLHQCQQIS